MFPLRDDNPTLRRAVVTFVFVLANVIVWAVVQGFGTNPTLTGSICSFGLIPGELLGNVHGGTRVSLGKAMFYTISATPHWSTLLTHMFMHGSWFHLIGNLWFLWVFGDNVEDVMGRIKFAVFYILCGLAAAGAQMYSNPSSTIPMVGASGAISGVMGAYAILYPRVGVHVLVFLVFFIQRMVFPAWLMLGYWFLLQFVSAVPYFAGSSSGGIAFWAHIGGFLAGVLLVFLFADRKKVIAHRALMRRWRFRQ
jgi:membrane associated rhomboid family serine protease